jgi:hypothetical protein
LDPSEDHDLVEVLDDDDVAVLEMRVPAGSCDACHNREEARRLALCSHAVCARCLEAAFTDQVCNHTIIQYIWKIRFCIG